MKIYLIGMPGCGKSTISRDLSRNLNLQRIDLDEEIVKTAGCSIEKIFAENGESYFRQLEKDTLEKFSALDNLIIATGGGAPCFFNNIELMNKTGITVFLNVPAETLTDRLIKPVQDVRPMVKNKSRSEVLDFVNTKLIERLKFYNSAKISVEGSNIQAKEILDRLKIMNT